MIEFAIGIVGNLVASFIYDTLRQRNSQLPPILLVSQSPSEEKQDENYDAGSNTIILIFAFIFALTLLKYAIYLPFVFGQEWFGETFDLGRAKIIGQFIDTTVTMSTLDTVTTVIASILLIPILLLSNLEVLPFEDWYRNKFGPVTFQSWLLSRIAVFLLNTLSLSGLITYAVTNLSYRWAVSIPFMIFLALVAVILITSDFLRF